MVPKILDTFQYYIMLKLVYVLDIIYKTFIYLCMVLL